MPKAADTQLSKLLGEGDPIPDGPATLGSRYIRSRAFRQRAAGTQESFDVKLLSADELARDARRRSIDMSGLVLEKPGPVEIETFPLPASIVGLVDIKTTGTMWNLYTGQTVLVPGGGGVPDGSGGSGSSFPPGSDVTVAFERELDEGIPWVVEAEVASEVLDDAAAAKEALADLMELIFWRELELDLIAGDGSTSGLVQHLVGLTNTPGITETPFPGAGTYRLETIADAAADVGTAEWFDQPLAVVASPQTLKRIFTERDVSSRPLGAVADKVVPSVQAWVPSLSIADGTAIVGAWKRGMVVWIRDPLSLRATSNYLDYFGRGLTRLQIRTRLTNRVRHTSAFQVVTGL